MGRALRGFFADHLPRVGGASPHTVRSYRDTFVLLLRFVATGKRCSVPELDIDHLGPPEVLDFLHDLEVGRHNIAATRNVRLAAIHAFFRYCAAEHPDRLEQCLRMRQSCNGSKHSDQVLPGRDGGAMAETAALRRAPHYSIVSYSKRG